MELNNTGAKKIDVSWVKNVWFQKISIPTPRMVIGNSEGEGGL